MSIKHLTLALSLAVGAFSAHAEDVSTAVLGLSTNNTTTYAQTRDTSAVADSFTAEQLAAFKGKKITKICVDVNGETAHLRVFVSRTHNGTPLSETIGKGTGEGWQTITLDEPYTITGEPICIGYEMEGLKTIRLSQTLLAGEEWHRRRSGQWEQYTNDNCRASLYAIIEDDNLPTSNGTITLSTIPEYIQTNSAIDFSGTLANIGNDAIQSAKFNILVDGETVDTQTVSGLNIRKRRSKTISFSGGNITTEGKHQVAFEIAEINGVRDTDLYCNRSEVVTALCKQEFTPRQVLLEVFSTENCTGCPAGHQTIEQALGKETGIIEVCHHAGFYTDPLTVDESVDYEWFYPPTRGGTFAPAVMFDRTNYVADLPDIFYADGPLADPTSTAFLQTVHELSNATPALASIDMQAEYDKTSRKLTVTVSGAQLLPLDNMDNVCLNVFLTEDSIYSTTQKNSNGSYWHRNTLRKVLTGTWGTTYDILSGGALAFEATLDATWQAEKMAVVAFFANYDSTDRNNCRVINTVRQAIIKEADSIEEATITTTATVSERYNAVGQTICQPQRGLNIVRMSDGSTRKVVVK